MLTQNEERNQAKDIHQIAKELDNIHKDLVDINSQIKAIIGLWGGVHRYPDIERGEKMYTPEQQYEDHAYDARIELNSFDAR